jgi:hypothetical protein
MHWYVEFRDPARPPGAEPTLFEWAWPADKIEVFQRWTESGFQP